MTTISRSPGPTQPAPVPTPPKPAQAAKPVTEPAAGAWGPKSAEASSKVAAPTTATATATPAEVAAKFYTAFQNRDLDGMRALYATNATFHDPIFDLHGRDETMKMWGGVFQKGKHATLSYDVVKSDASSATIKWKADYQLGGRPVHNESLTTLTVKDGAITAQKDDWSWSKWAHQALPLGPLVDVPLLKNLLIALIRKL